jgi:chemotaxis protein methyltransferase WspC
MAMCALHAGWPAEQVQVEALDRSREFLRIAEHAEYGPASIRTEIPAWAMSYLRHDGQCVGIDPMVRGMVRFRPVDVSQTTALSGAAKFDVIFCRNVLIYLNAAVRERLLDAIGASLADDGMLFVGHAEQMIRSTKRTHAFRPVSISHSFALERVAGGVPDVERSPDIVINTDRRIKAAGPRKSVSVDVPTPVKRSPQLSPAMDTPREDTLEDARALADAGHTHEVEPMVRSIIARRGPSAQAFELLGMIRMTENDADGARRLFEQAVYLEPNRSTSLLQLAMISERAGDNSRAATLWDRARRASSPAGREARP